MTPQAELCVPKSEPIPVREISPSSMATFLKESHPGLEFEPSPSYPQIFSKLRGLPFDEQEKLLVGFYSQKVEAFPNGAELGRFLARINNIHWFQPKSPPDRKSLEGLCQQTLSRLNLPDLTLSIIKGDRMAIPDEDTDEHIQATITLGAHLDADGDPTRGYVSDEVLYEARRAVDNTIPLSDVLDKAEAAAQDPWAHVATHDAADDAIIKSALLDVAEHPGDPARDAALDEALDAAVAHREAREAAYAAAREAAQAAADGATQAAIDAGGSSAAHYTALWSAYRAAINAARGARWIVVKDLMCHHMRYNKGNPFEPLMEIYELGCWPIGFGHSPNGEKTFAVFIPLFKKPPKTTS